MLPIALNFKVVVTLAYVLVKLQLILMLMRLPLLGQPSNEPTLNVTISKGSL
jgi:hypothetical protein